MLTLNYQFQGKGMTACFEITKAGKLRAVPCANRNRLGIGGVAKKVTKLVGIKPCGGCQRRAAQLDAATPGWVVSVLERLRKLWIRVVP